MSKKIWDPESDELLEQLYYRGVPMEQITYQMSCNALAVKYRLKLLSVSELDNNPRFIQSLNEVYIKALKIVYPHLSLGDMSDYLGKRRDYVKASILYLVSEGVIPKCLLGATPLGWTKQEYIWLVENAAQYELTALSAKLHKTIPDVKHVLCRRGLKTKDEIYLFTKIESDSHQSKKAAGRRKYLSFTLVEASAEELEKIKALYPYFHPQVIAKRCMLNMYIVYRAVDRLIAEGILDQDKPKAYFPKKWTYEEFMWFKEHVSEMPVVELARQLNKGESEVRSVLKAIGHTEVIKSPTPLERMAALRTKHTIDEIAQITGKPPDYIAYLFERYDAGTLI